jgi:hypothetical protein
MRKTYLVVAILITALCVFTASAWGTTYYVDSSVASSGNGLSWATAWKTVGNITGLAAGDIVYFSGGTSGQSYSVSNWLPAGGTSSNPITYAVGQDAQHNGMVTFTGSGSWITGNNMANFTIDGHVGTAAHITVANTYSWTVYCDGTQSRAVYIKLTYINFSAPMWLRGQNWELSYSKGTNPPLSMNDDSYIAHMGEGGTGWGTNQFHHNVIQVWRRRDQGCGQDALKWFGAVDVHDNVILSLYNAGYTGCQHNDGMQVNNDYFRIYNNYFEGFISYPIYNEIYGNESHWRIYNNVISAYTADRASIDWGAYQCMALGFSQTGTVSDYIVANNTCIGSGAGGGTNGIHFNTGVPGTVGSGCYIVNNLVYNSNTTILYNGNPTVSNNVGGTSGVAFTNIAPYPSGDFHLTSSATAAIDKAISPTYLTSVYTTDKDGNLRPIGAWDIGTYQFSVSGSTSPTSPTGLTAMIQ